MFTKPDENGTWYCKWTTGFGGKGIVQLWAPNRLAIRVHSLDGKILPFKPSVHTLGWAAERPCRAPWYDFSEQLCYSSTLAIYKAMQTSANALKGRFG
jgi:hypothetical protein